MPEKIVDAIKDGFAGPELKAEMDELQGAQGITGRAVDAILIVPAGNELRIELKGNLAAMLSAAQNAPCSLTFGCGMFTRFGLAALDDFRNWLVREAGRTRGFSRDLVFQLSQVMLRC